MGDLKGLFQLSKSLTCKKKKIIGEKEKVREAGKQMGDFLLKEKGEGILDESEISVRK